MKTVAKLIKTDKKLIISSWLLGGVADLKLVATLPTAQAGGHLVGGQDTGS